MTDLILFQSRGGELEEVDKDDLAIVEGRYFELFLASARHRAAGVMTRKRSREPARSPALATR